MYSQGLLKSARAMAASACCWQRAKRTAQTKRATKLKCDIVIDLCMYILTARSEERSICCQLGCKITSAVDSGKAAMLYTVCYQNEWPCDGLSGLSPAELS